MDLSQMLVLIKLSIVPQTFGRLAASGLRLSALIATGMVLLACSTVQVPLDKPGLPETLTEARQYMSARDAELDRLDYELNVLERSCYKRFFISDCVDDVRSQRNDYRRAHIKAEAAAAELIRLDRYQKKSQTN